MQKLRSTGLLAAGLSLSLGSIAPAHSGLMFLAIMTHDQEVASPPIPNEGSSGIARFFLNDAMTRLTYDVQLTGLDLGRVDPATGNPNLAPPAGDPNDDVTRLHIHRAPTGVNGGIVFGMIDASAGLRNDNNPNDLLIDVAGLHITGAWDLPEGNAGLVPPANLGTELSNLLNGGLYINIHTADHAGGEIRGQILLIPEPGSAALLSAGLLGLMVPALRRLKK